MPSASANTIHNITISISVPTLSLAKRAGILFLNFFLIILAYYHIKPASRSLFIEYLGPEMLPYVWIGTALVLGGVLSFYHWLVECYSRLSVVLATCGLFAALLITFWWLLGEANSTAAIGFYIFADIFSVILVEQFWSLTNSVYTTEEGKRWYGVVGLGGLVGGVMGGTVASYLLQNYLATEDLLLVASGILVLIFVLNLIIGRLGLFNEAPRAQSPVIATGSWQSLWKSRYLLLIAIILLLVQIASPLVEYQFINTVSEAFPDKDERTAYIARFFSWMGAVSIGINLVVTPLVHRYLGVIAGLWVQPLLLSLFSLAFMMHPTLWVAVSMKISDRGLSYSINRASKELLYVPIDPIRAFQAKAWIDMFGYRAFKVFGALIILLVTQWLPLEVDLVDLGWLSLTFCGLWMITLHYLAKEYRDLMSRADAT